MPLRFLRSQFTQAETSISRDGPLHLPESHLAASEHGSIALSVVREINDDVTVYLHDGRASTLKELLRKSGPENADGEISTVTDDEIADLIESTRSL